jgi:hypothetical protein
MTRSPAFLLASVACLAVALAMPAAAASNPATEEAVAETAFAAEVPTPKVRPAVRKRVASPAWRRWSATPVYRPAPPPLPRVAIVHWPLILGIGY